MNALLSTREVAEQLHVSPNTVKKLWREGRLRGVQLSQRKLRFHQLDVQDFLRQTAQSAASPSLPYRWKEWAWRTKNREVLNRLKGQWVVVEGSEMISHGVDPVQAVEQARAEGISTPYVFYVPESADGGATMSL